MSIIRTILAASCAIASIAAVAPASAQDAYPSKPVKIIVALPAGGSVDAVARIIGQQLSTDLGQPFIVDNRGGASGQIGVPMAAKAPPDGYTIMISPASFLTTNKSVFKTLPYDPQTDFIPVTKLVNQAMVLVVKDKSKYGTPAELLAAAKASPGKLTFGSSGDGSPQHLAGLLFQSKAGVQLLHVPYKGGALAITDLMGGSVDMVFAPLPEALPYIKSGKLWPVGVLAEKRATTAPDLPTLKDGGLDGIYMSAWIGLLVPAGTPKPVVDKLNVAVKNVFKGETSKKLMDLGLEPVVDEAKPLGTVIAEEIKLHADLTKAAGLVPQ